MVEIHLEESDRLDWALKAFKRKIAKAGVDLDLVYVATRNRVVFGAADLDALRVALDGAS